MTEFELPTERKLIKLLQAKYGKPNFAEPEGSGDYGKGYLKGYNLGYEDGAYHAWQEMNEVMNAFLDVIGNRK